MSRIVPLLAALLAPLAAYAAPCVAAESGCAE
jgi:hypothetical protein